VTLFAALWSVGHGLLIAFNPDNRLWFLLLPVTLFARMALNAVDGMLAREHNQKSRLGAILNEVSDVISDAALYLPFALVAGLSPVAAVLSVVLAGLSEMTGVTAVTIGAQRRYDGPMGKSDRATAFGALGLLLGLGFQPASWMVWVQWLIAVLLVVTVFNRARRALQSGSAS
jgi:CDP-diacylglycerol--glycerol-3-phosphate 3-phosphatidyltransferase